MAHIYSFFVSIHLHGREHKVEGMGENTESILAPIKALLTQIETLLSGDHDGRDNYLSEALSAIRSLDSIDYFNQIDHFSEQKWIVEVLQDYAYYDSDNGTIKEIADWCRSSWLRILRDHPRDIDTLAGLGRNWLQRSQAALARIHHEEGSGSSGSGSASEISIVRESKGRRQQLMPKTGSAVQRLQNHLYIEARGDLQPATDFFQRAVLVATEAGTLTGPLLASAAEAYMSLGNVSPPRSGEQLFDQAIRYLKLAEAIPGYTLSVYLRQYLEDYGRFVT